MYRNIIILRSWDSARREQEPKLAWRLLPSRSISSRSKDSARRVKRKNKTTIFWKRVIYSWTRVARNERIEWIGRNESDVRDERNVRNKRDEQIWRNTVFVFRAKRLRRHLRGRIAFQTDISTCYSAPSQKPNGKAQKKWRKRATSKRSNRVQRILLRMLRETNNPREPQSQRILLSSSSFRARSGSIFPNLMRLLLYFHQFTNLRFSTFLLSGR